MSEFELNSKLLSQATSEIKKGEASTRRAYGSVVLLVSSVLSIWDKEVSGEVRDALTAAAGEAKAKRLVEKAKALLTKTGEDDEPKWPAIEEAAESGNGNLESVLKAFDNYGFAREADILNAISPPKDGATAGRGKASAQSISAALVKLGGVEAIKAVMLAHKAFAKAEEPFDLLGKLAKRHDAVKAAVEKHVN